MAQLLPVTNDVRQSFTTVVNSQKIKLTIYYLNDDLELASTGWFCDMELLSGTESIIISGARLRSQLQIAKNVVSDFSGGIFVVPITSPHEDLTSLTPWGNTHQLVYFTEDELVEVTSE